MNEIWGDDRLSRRAEADALVGYLESVARRDAGIGAGRAHVLAVDASYGFGKTFFLQRLKRHLGATEHAAAFIDAWVDDLADEPIVSLAATLEDALSPFIVKAPALGAPLNRFKGRAAKVFRITALGLARKAAELVVTRTGAEQLSGALSEGNSTLEEVDQDILKAAGTGLVADVEKAFEHEGRALMDERIASFRAGRAAIAAMKRDLAEVVEALDNAGMKLPIVIIVDELDRCRPTYAIKVLEEIKHLFDVPGVAFVLGLHGAQLEASIAAAYGASFDSSAYLRRFFHRRYRLAEAPLAAMIMGLFDRYATPVERLIVKPIIGKGALEYGALTPAQQAALIMKMYGVGARDAGRVVESLDVALRLTDPYKLDLPYLITRLIGHVLGGGLPSSINQPDWDYVGAYSRSQGEHGRDTHNAYVASVLDLAGKDQFQLIEIINSDRRPPGIGAFMAEMNSNIPAESLAKIRRTDALLNTVSRFAAEPS